MKKSFLNLLLCILFSIEVFGQINDQQLKAKESYDLGYSLNGNHEFKKAVKQLKKAIEIDSTGNCGTGKNGSAHGELGYAYTRLDDFENALFYLSKAIDLDKTSPQRYLNKSVLLMQHGKNDLALETLNSLITNIPDYVPGYVQRGFLYNSNQKYELALADFNKSLLLIKEQNQEQYSSAMVDEIKKQINEIKSKLLK
jgi:tetratricopeptide (TPR) repeat protein